MRPFTNPSSRLRPNLRINPGSKLRTNPGPGPGTKPGTKTKKTLR